MTTITIMLSRYSELSHSHDDVLQDHAASPSAQRMKHSMRNLCSSIRQPFRMLMSGHMPEDINRRFAHRRVTTGQIIVFGLTGGLIPCPASITVLLLCLQLGKVSLGALLVLCFSVGLALTMVLVGAAAALGVRHVSTRWSGSRRHRCAGALSVERHHFACRRLHDLSGVCGAHVIFNRLG